MFGWSSLPARLTGVGRPRQRTSCGALAVAKARDVPNILKANVKVAWFRRWSNILSCAAARSFADSLLEVRGAGGAGGNVPSSSCNRF